MTIEMASLVLAAFTTAVTLFWFLLIAVFNAPTADFYFAERSLKSTSIRSTLAATATSLAGAIFFFMGQTGAFGWVIVIVPLATAIGYYVFLKITKDITPDPMHTGSIKRVIKWKTNSNILSNFANSFVAVNFFSVYLIEIIIGSKIFSYFIGGSVVGMVFFSFVISAVVLFYVLRGGFSAVAFTDKWQFQILFSALFVALISVSYSFYLSDHSIGDIFIVFTSPKLPNYMLIIFLINLVVINVTLPTTQISTWQRYSAACSKDEAIKGFRRGIIWGVIPLWFFSIAIAALLIVVSDGGSGFVGLFDFLRSNSLIGALVVFPLLFAGLIAALLSTADSFMNSTMLAIEDFFPRNERSSVQAAYSIRKRMIVTGCFLAVFGVLGSFVTSESADVNDLITKLLFAAYGIPCLLFPIVLFSFMDKAPETGNYTAIISGLIASFCVLVGAATYGITQDSFAVSMLGPVAGVAVSSIGVYIGVAKRGRA